MINLTHSDILNIEVYKGLIKTINNDIQDVKNSNGDPHYKAKIIFKLTQDRSNLIQNARKNYPQINWVSEAIQLNKKRVDKETLFKNIIAN